MHRIFIVTMLVFALIVSACKDSSIVNVKSDKNQIVESYKIGKDSVKNGFYKKFYEDGSLKETSTYSNGLLDGERILFFPNGAVEIKENYKNGQITGPYYEYYPNGQINTSFIYSNGNINGELLKYFENGKIEEKVTFVDGDENGPFTEYYENGTIHWQGQYLNGDNEFGLLKEFDENGQLIKKMMCDSLAICRTTWTLKDGDITPKF